MSLNYSRLLSIIFFLFSSEIGAYYYAGVTPYSWDDNGTTWILLGQEKRGHSQVWADFGGSPEKKDNDDPYITALREFSEETAHRVELRPYSSTTLDNQKAGTRAVRFYLPVYYIAPKKIQDAAAAVRTKAHAHRHPSHVEKIDWRWVKASDLLDKSTGLEIWSKYQKNIDKDKKIIQNIIDHGHSRAQVSNIPTVSGKAGKAAAD